MEKKDPIGSRGYAQFIASGIVKLTNDNIGVIIVLLVLFAIYLLPEKIRQVFTNFLFKKYNSEKFLKIKDFAIYRLGLVVLGLAVLIIYVIFFIIRIENGGITFEPDVFLTSLLTTFILILRRIYFYILLGE